MAADRTDEATWNAQSNETLRGLLGLSLEDDSFHAANASESDKIFMHEIKVVSKLLRTAEKNNGCIDDIFRHEHFLYGCDGIGAYYIISSWCMAQTPRGMPIGSMITAAVIRCHDNFRDSMFLPTEAQYSEPLFQQFLQDRRKDCGLDFRRVSYKLCAKLITECLQRMRLSNKNFQGKKARTVARLFGLQTRDPFHQVVPSLPEPSPAPNVESIWITINRPEYYFFSVNEDLHNLFKIDVHSRPIDERTYQRAMRYITKDEYRRNRVYAMLEHMALWHTVGNEMRVASWLLWERAAMMNTTDENSAIQAMESNIVVQLMINKYFDGGTGFRTILQFPNLGLYGTGMTNYILYQDDLRERGTLPPNFIYTASIANRSAVAAASGANSVGSENADDSRNDSGGSIRTLAKAITLKKGSCAVCGSTTSADTGGPLNECGRCHSVVYCCKDHQVLHWKKGGHKQECMPT